MSTAATGLFQKEHLALKYPTVPPKPNGKTLLVWAGSSGVGSNAIRLATAAGYEVYTTASPKYFEYVKRLGAIRAFDYRSPTVIQDLIPALQYKTLAGALAIGNNGAESCIAVLEKSKSRRFVAMSGQTLTILSLMLSVIRSQLSMRFMSIFKGIPTKFIIGNTLQYNKVSYVVYEDFLAQALAVGRYVAAAEPFVIGHGLEYIQQALDFQKKGVWAKKVVVTLLKNSIY